MAAPVRPGAVLDAFAVGELVHAGGMADLYAVTGPEPGTPLVMKLPRLGHGEPVTTVISWEVEATVLGAARGPHAPRLVAVGDVARTPYLVMERVEGRPLKEWTDRAPLPPGEVARLGAAVAVALHDLHRQEIVHLDVKPSNVLVRPDGAAVLVDFGLAFHAHFPDLIAEDFRRPVGTAAYMAPEQVLGDRGDPRSDVYALGAMLYELATGRLPFGTPTSLGGLRRRLWRDPIPPRALVPAVPEWLQEVILRCVEPDRDERYATAAQVAHDLTAPEAVAVGERGRRVRHRGVVAALRRRLRAAALERGDATPRARISRAPVVLVAVATARPDEQRFEALRDGVRRLVALAGDVRVACVTVIPPSPDVTGDDEATATRQRIRHLATLRHWAAPLHLAPGRLSTHVLEARDPAQALLDFASTSAVDHVFIGGPPPRTPAAFRAATVAMRVAAGARCSVTVVRPLGAGGGREGPAGPPRSSPGGGSPGDGSPA